MAGTDPDLPDVATADQTETVEETAPPPSPAHAARRAPRDHRDRAAAGRGRPARGRRHRPGRAGRRAGLRLPLLPPRLPDPAAPRGLGHGVDRPDRLRRTSPSLDEAFGDAEWILHAASQDLPCLREVGLRPVAALRHRARRAPARLPPGRPGHAGRGDHGPLDAQGALRGRLVEATAAAAVAGVRRPRRRGPARAARGHRRRADRVRQGRVGGRGVPAPHRPRARRPGRTRGGVRPASTRPRAAARSPPCASCG